LSASLPFLSVIVPAFNRPDGLKALLAALEDQSYPPYRFEVLVCDDGSTPPLAERVGIKDCPFSVRFLRDTNQGPATARNRGIREARGSIVAFTDDDCLPEPTWLETIAEAMRDAALYAVHGPVKSAVPPIDPFVHSLNTKREDGVATANLAVRREMLLAVGGFDETFAAPYFEDFDLAKRLEAAYGPIAWRDDMVVQHPHRVVPFRKAFQTAGFYRYLPYMQRKHPGFWPKAMAGVRKRSLAKAVLVLIGLAPLAGAPWSLAIAWIGLFAWQATRLQDLLKRLVAYNVAVPVQDQLAFVFFGWAVDFARWSAYVSGKGMQAKPAPAEELVLE
jgi:glycosyltransferase involved in cell wall biosynthesis